jgi:hypothetical protein
MGKRRTAIRDVLDATDYRRLLATAARLEDRERALETFFLLVTLGRLGLRVGEAIHMRESWFSPERSQVDIPPHVACDCGLCRHYAAQADEADLADYWRPKNESDRSVYVYTDRDRDALERHFRETSYTGMSYSTASRRVKLAAELTDGIDATRVYPHMLRATAATHLAWSDARGVTLDTVFGWANPETRTEYIRRTGYLARQDIDALLGRDVDTPDMLLEDPPTFGELRRDGGLVEVESWVPDVDVETHPRGRDPEDQLDLDRFSASADRSPRSSDRGVGLVGSLPVLMVVSAVMCVLAVSLVPPVLL